MGKEFLLEIGTKKIPAGFINPGYVLGVFKSVLFC
jgi:hypothetical protein